MPRIWEDSVASHKERLRAHIIATAVRLVTAHGAMAVSMSGLASAAGIGRATLYNYFADLDSVLLAWATDSVDSFVARVEGELAGIADARVRLRRCVQLHLAEVGDSAHQLQLDALPSTVGAHAAEQFTQHWDRLREVVAGVLRGGVAQGHWSGDLDAAVHADLILGMVAALRPAITSGRLNSVSGADLIERLLRHGLPHDRKGSDTLS